MSPVDTLERWTDEATHWVQLAERKPKVLGVLGVVLIALFGLIVTLIFMSFGGEFSSYATVRADLPEEGAAVLLNSPVEYRDVTVGKVATTATATPGGGVSVVLHLKPSQLSAIPENVTATVAPISIFGNQYVVLLPPSTPSTVSLVSGATVPAVGQGTTASVQTTLADLDHLLVQIHPAQLYSALSALADALQGQGQPLGVTLVRFNTYLHNMLPLWPRAVQDLQLLQPVATGVTQATPQILSTLSHFSQTSKTISNGQFALSQLLTAGTTFAQLTTNLLSNIQQPYAELVAASGPFLRSLAQTPTTISQILEGLDSWAKTWVAAEANGPYLTLNSSPVVVNNPADLALAALGGPNVTQLLSEGLGPGVVNPPTYTAANCPRYGTLVGPNCGGASAASAQAALDSVTILPEPQEQDAIETVATGLNGGTPVASASLASLYLGPVLDHVVGGP